MTKKGIITTIIFLGLTIAALGTELLFSFDGDEDTHPWTDLIVRYVPWEVGLAALGALMLWVPVHFYVRYRRKHKQPTIIIDNSSTRIPSANSEVWAGYGRHVYTECPNPGECPVHLHYITQEDLRKDDGS